MTNCQITATDAEGNTTRQYYDLLGNKTKLILPEQYNSTTDSGLGYTYEYNANDNLTKLIDPLSQITRYTYNVEGQKTKVIDANNYNISSDNGSGYQYIYDTSDRLIKVRNHEGQEARIIYNGVGNIIKKIDANNYNESTDDGKGIEYKYDKLNRLIQVKDTEGNITNKYIYDENNRIIESIDANGYSTYYEYNLAGWLIETKEPLTEDKEGTINYRTTKYEYNKNGNIIKKTTPEGYITEYKYDEANRLVEVKQQVTEDTLNQNTTSVFLESPRKTVYPNNTYEYKLKLAPDEDIQVRDISIELEYDPRIIELVETKEYKTGLTINTETLGKILITATGTNYTKEEILAGIKINIKDKTTGTAYITISETSNYTDQKGEKNKFSKGIGSTINSTIPDMNKDNKVATDDFTLTAKLNNTQITDSKYRERYDINGNQVIDTTDLDYITDWLFLDNKETNEQPLTKYKEKYTNSIYETTSNQTTRTTTFKYDKVGNITEITDTNGNKIKYTYDKQGRLITETDKEGATSRLYYDQLGNITKQISKENNSKNNNKGTTYIYDSMNRLKQIIDANGNTQETYTYNKKGQITKITDANGNGTTYTYDIGGRTTSITTPEAKEKSKTNATYTYDAKNNIITYTDGEGNTTTYERNMWGNATKITDDNGVETNYKYDYAGNIIETIDGKGNKTTYKYNTLNKIKEITDPLNQTVTFKYDKEGRLREEIDRNGNVINYKYNSDSNLISKEVGDQKELYLYKKDGNLLAAINNKTIETYEYTTNGNLANKTRNGETILSYTYNKDGNVTSVVDRDNKATNYTYDTLGRIQNVLDESTVVATYKYNINNTKDQVTYNNGVKINYSYDKNNNITQITNKKADGTNINNLTYTYDNNGNRLTETRNGQTTSYTYDNLNRLAKVEYPTNVVESFTYDNANNRLTRTIGEETTNYTYDANNRLIESITNNITTNYTYDNNGNLLEENKNGQITTYTYDGFNRTIGKTNPNGTWQESIYNALGMRIGTVENGTNYEFTYDRGNIINEADANGQTITRTIRGYELIAQDNKESGISYYLNNAHGDILNLVDVNGNVQNTYTYDAFGKIQQAEGKVANRFLYAGEQYDRITGEYHLRARNYNPELGRFTQEDTYRGDGLNLYAYVANNPINYIDPSGNGKDNGKEARPWLIYETVTKSYYYNGERIIRPKVDIYGRKGITTWEMVTKFLEGARDGFNEKKDSISLSGAWEGIVDLFKTIKDSSSEELKQLIIESIEASIRELDSKVDDFEEYVIKGGDEKKAAYQAGKSLVDAVTIIAENSNAIGKLGKMGRIADRIIDSNKKRSNGKDGNSNRTVNLAGNIASLKNKTPNQLLEEGWKDITDPRKEINTTSRDYYNPETGMKISFDAGKKGATGFEAVDHYHVYNPNYTNKKVDYYYDINGNATGKGSKASHIVIEKE